MRWRVLFFISLGANVVLAVAWMATHRPSRRHEAASEGALSPGVTRTNVLVRRQFFTWNELESADYPTYITNLRDIGCPEQTIRDIIIADINSLYARRRAIDPDIISPQQQWWRSEPDPSLVRLATERTRALEDERRALLTRLLGPYWESGDFVSLPRPSRPGIVLDGPVLGYLPTETKSAIEDIRVRAEGRVETYLAAQRELGRTPDPAELARLRQQTRDELTRILAPPQLEEYLLRYSQNANDLRAELGQLAHFNATPDEFRAIFRATDGIDLQLQLLTGDDPVTAQQRRLLEQQRDVAIKTALPADRYKQFTQFHDPLYRDAFASAQEAGTPDAVQTLYELNLANAIQQATIRANTNLTAEQRAIELKRIELEQMRANALAIGQELPADPAAAPPVPATPTPPPVSAHPYVLAVGDTISSVGMRYGVSTRELQAANPDLDFRRLKPGQTIRIPDRLPTFSQP
jgi:LysM repeat protein